MNIRRKIIVSEVWNKSTLFIEFPRDIKILEEENDIYLVDIFGGRKVVYV